MTERISQDMLDDMFDGLNPRWDVTGNLLWGYFFNAPQRYVLASMAEELVGDGYKLVDIYLPDSEEGEPQNWWLHVERIEHHTSSSLFARNASFYDLADRYDSVVYDGMDVGPILNN